MDSLTQIVLGAAVGEVVLGKKIGNRAMLWGAVGGTLPDLDIIAYAFTDEMTALAFHRGISHSLFFAVVAPVVLASMTRGLYSTGIYRQRWYRGLFIAFWVILLFLLGLVPRVLFDSQSLVPLYVMGFLALIFGGLLVKYYFLAKFGEVKASWRDWYLLFFWSIITHPLLDCCTAYGTQLFQPFSDHRVAWNNISVVDPIYTFFLLIGITIAAWLLRYKSARRWINYTGIACSSVYLLLTFYNKHHVNEVFENSLREHNIPYERYMTVPTIFNNVLWQGVAEVENGYYHGFYSLLDKQPRVLQFNYFPKNWHLPDQYGYQNEPALEMLKWFSNGYYNFVERKDGRLQLNDMRYGTYSEGAKQEEHYIFKFLFDEKDGRLDIHQARDRGPPTEGGFKDLFVRIKGI